jgi:hypothetical protein
MHAYCRDCWTLATCCRLLLSSSTGQSPKPPALCAAEESVVLASTRVLQYTSQNLLQWVTGASHPRADRVATWRTFAASSWHTTFCWRKPIVISGDDNHRPIQYEACSCSQQGDASGQWYMCVVQQVSVKHDPSHMVLV